MPRTFTYIASTTLSVATQTITFSNIPQTYTDLCLKLSARGNRPGFSYQDVLAVVNGQANSMYGQVWNKRLDGQTAAASSVGDRFWFSIPAAASPYTNGFSANELYMYDYTSGNSKLYYIDEVDFRSTTEQYIINRSMIFDSGNSVTSISFNTQTDAFIAGTNAILYGVKRA